MTTEQTLHPSDEPEDDKPDLLLRLSKWWIFAAIGIFLIYSVVLGFTTISGYLTTKNHSSEIAAIRQTQVSNENGKSTTASDAKAIGNAVALAEAEINSNHGSTRQGQVSLCAALNGIIDAEHLPVTHCVIPPS